MAEHPGIMVPLVRFLPREGETAQRSSSACEEEGSRVITIGPLECDREQQMDDEYVSEFRMRYMSDQSMVYLETVVSNSEETVEAIRALDRNHDLYVVGRRQGLETRMTAGLTDWSEFPELGPFMVPARL